MENSSPKNDSKKDSVEILNINVSRIIVGLTEIGNLAIEDFDTNMAISKTIANLSTVEKAYGKSMQAIMKKYIKTDASGNFMSENGFYLFENQNDKLAYTSETDKLNDTTVTEKVWTFKATFLKDVKGLKGTTLAKCHELIVDDRETSKI